MTTLDELEARLAELEARAGAGVQPLANPPIQIGELTDVPAPGSPIASQWAQEASARIVHRFATAAARATAFPAPVRGTASYLQTNTDTEGPEWFDGASWRKPWNMPWGRIGHASRVADVNAIGTAIVDLPGLTVTFAALGFRVYRVNVHTLAAPGAAGGTVYLRDGNNVTLNQCNVLGNNTGVAAGTIGGVSICHLMTPATGSITVKVSAAAASGSSFAIPGASTYPNWLVVEDVGPVPGAPQ
jgi:hypothetical protein